MKQKKNTPTQKQKAGKSQSRDESEENRRAKRSEERVISVPKNKTENTDDSNRQFRSFNF